MTTAQPGGAVADDESVPDVAAKTAAPAVLTSRSLIVSVPGSGCEVADGASAGQ